MKCQQFTVDIQTNWVALIAKMGCTHLAESRPAFGRCQYPVIGGLYSGSNMGMQSMSITLILKAFGGSAESRLLQQADNDRPTSKLLQGVKEISEE
jgi:hypothetical protein